MEQPRLKRTDHNMNEWLSKSVRQIFQLVKDEFLASSLCSLLERQFSQLQPV